jgi:hypothetical protein
MQPKTKREREQAMSRKPKKIHFKLTVEAQEMVVDLHGDCVEIMRQMQPASIDFVITDPPYITRYCARDGRSVANDDNARWLKPAFAQMHRLLKSAAFCISFYGWNKADLFIDAWRAAGFRIAGHLVFRKKYPSSVRFLRYQHEQAWRPLPIITGGKPRRRRSSFSRFSASMANRSPARAAQFSSDVDTKSPRGDYNTDY